MHACLDMEIAFDSIPYSVKVFLRCGVAADPLDPLEPNSAPPPFNGAAARNKQPRSTLKKASPTGWPSGFLTSVYCV